MDRISNLPDEIICHIGSFLSAKEAAFTRVLSKRWRNLSVIIPDLQFYDLVYDDGENFKDFVDQVLAHPPSTRVRKFSLHWPSAEIVQYDHINTCLRDVLKRGVLDLHLSINGKEGYSLPLEVFTCKTLTKLSLGFAFSIGILPPNAFLPDLKSLLLSSIRFSEFVGRCAFKMLLAACPVLEELTMRRVNWEHWKWSRTVSSLSLKRLTITRSMLDSFDDSDFKSISFDTPGLAFLDYSDYVPREYPHVNLGSLVEAKLYLCPGENHMWEESDANHFRPMNLLKGLKNVEILNLRAIQTSKMFHVFRGMLPVFEKLSHLMVDFSNYCWFPLPMLIKKSPSLKTLTVDGSLHYRSFYYRPESTVCGCLSEYSFLLLCPLENLKITEYYGSLEELIHMKYILGNLSCLELVEVHSWPAGGDGRKKLISDLQMLPRASSKCKFEVVS